jgi:quercetin dioxygenase-like cupin family protein
LKGVLIVNLKLRPRALIAAVCFAPLVQAEPLLKTTTSWDGGQFHYPKGQAEVSSVILNIAEGVTTKFHCHPVPTLGYILKGDVEVETKDGKKVVLKQGESAVEVMRTVHRGRALSGPVEILVFYAGDTQTPNTVLPENDPEHHYCNN